MSNGLAWLILFFAGLCEVGWAIGLKYAAGFSRFWPSVWTLVMMVVSVLLLGWALKTLPLGTAYAVWTGIGAVVTVVYAAATGAEHLTALRGLFLVGIIGCVVGLKKTSDDEQQAVAEELVEEPMDVD